MITSDPLHRCPDSGDPHDLRLGVVADPGLPAQIAARLADGELAEALSATVTPRPRWQVEVVIEALPLDEQGTVPIAKLGAERRSREGWDVVVYLTDLPRRSGTQPVMADLSISHAAALISLPAVGWLRPRHHVRETIVYLVRRLAQACGTVPAARGRALPRRPTEWASPVREITSAQPGIDLSLALVGWRGHARLLFGMVRDNRPWQLVPHLASATAAAAATAAFGIFYNSIWNMAEALSPWRLALITSVAISAMAGWLLVYNHLWDPSAGHSSPVEAVLYNLSTIATLLLGVACMYGILYVLALAAALTVIGAGYLHATLGRPVGIQTYATIVWLASSMGIVAGALGSSLDSEEAVRQATYSRRERERQATSAARLADAPSKLPPAR